MNLSKLINQYVIYRKSLGEKFKSNEKVLKLFANAAGTNKINEISEKMINDFLYNNSPITSTWFVKHSTLNGFYQYLISRGFVSKSPLTKLLPKKPDRFVPYVYSKKEIKRILKTATNYQEAESHNQPTIIRMILLLLYSTGLRLNEALSLKLSDIDLDRLVITVRHAKFFKSRLVPFSNQLGKVLTDYIIWRKNFGYAQDIEAPLFISKKRLPISSSTIRKIFRRIRVKASINRNDDARYQPRIHDLRHTFAVHRLTHWYKENRDVQKMLPMLSVYMGHSSITHTSIYLTMTSNLLAEAGDRFEQYVWGGL